MKDRSPPIVFQVLGDGKQLWASLSLRGDKVAACDIDVSEVDAWKLRTSCDGGNFGAWAVWLDPRVVWK